MENWEPESQSLLRAPPPLEQPSPAPPCSGLGGAYVLGETSFDWSSPCQNRFPTKSNPLGPKVTLSRLPPHPSAPHAATVVILARCRLRVACWLALRLLPRRPHRHVAPTPLGGPMTGYQQQLAGLWATRAHQHGTLLCSSRASRVPLFPQREQFEWDLAGGHRRSEVSVQLVVQDLVGGWIPSSIGKLELVPTLLGFSRRRSGPTERFRNASVILSVEYTPIRIDELWQPP